MAKTTSVYALNGAYLVVDKYDGGICIADAICAFSTAEEAVYEFCDEQNFTIHNLEMVNGWDEANNLLRRYGYEPDTLVFDAA